ncbi:MAG: carbonic anhydrase [Victivallales bacterium]
MNNFGKYLIVPVLGIIVVAWGAFALAAGSGADMSADEAIKRLMDGNKRYAESKMTVCGETTKETREILSKGQRPYAIILSCSDSRVPPEIIFDKTLGEIFVIRVAGNVPGPIVLGSIEYAAEEFGSPLIMVLGHQRCGAVTASVDAHGKPEGNIGAIIKAIMPAVKKAKQGAKEKSKGDLVEKAVDYNIRLTAENITEHSPIIKRLIKEGKVKLVKAKYDLDDGKVTLY